MAIYPADQTRLRNRFSTEEMRRIWDEENLLRKRLEVEVALAKAQKALGIIPGWAADQIAEKCSTEYITPQLVYKFQHVGDIVAILRACEEVMGEAAEYIHFGLTTQDVLDTSLALALKDSWKIIYRDCRELEEILLNLTDEHKHSVMAGRPHSQYGTVITFGFKVATWVVELRNSMDRLRECRKRVFVASLGGSHGTFAPLRGQGLRMQHEALNLLGLPPALICTHAARDRHGEFLSVLAMLEGCLERISRTIYTLHRPEIFELEGPFVEGKQVDSSTMPHRRGPSGVDWVMGFARIMRGNALTGLETIVEDERDVARRALDHAVLPESCLLVDASLQFMCRYIRGMTIHTENMERNITEYVPGKGVGGLFIQGESVMYALAAKTGKKQSAHGTIYRIAQKAFRDRVDFRDALIKNQELRQYLSEPEIDEALDPHKYTGEAPTVVDNVIAECREARRVEEEELGREGLL